MDSYSFVHIADARSVIADKNGELWLPLDESRELSNRTETVEIAGVYFDVLGYSSDRDALLVTPIVIEGAADDIGRELWEITGGKQ